jgi:hypothetical protein
MSKDKKFKIVDKPAADPPTLILTRYLYIKQEVLASLAISLIESNLDESLFWAYELYYSGFEKECMDFLISIYHEWYVSKNPRLAKFLNTQYKKWSESKEVYRLATLIRNFMNREFVISKGEFGDGLLTNGDACKNEYAPDNGFYIQLDESEITKYKTAEKEKEEQPYRVLQRGCRFNIRNYANSIFGCGHADISKEDLYLIYRNQWLYYASFSPIWYDRIETYGGYIHHELKAVTFVNEDDEDEFYDEYGYNPDEQPKEVIGKFI